MGCTSSAPNTVPVTAAADKSDKSIQFEDEAYGGPSIEVEVADIESENRNETKVLPACDTDPLHLVRHNKSSSSLLCDKDVPINGHINESEDNPPKPQEEIKIPKLELLMEKVLENNHHLNEDRKSGDNVKMEEENTPNDNSDEANTKADGDKSETYYSGAEEITQENKEEEGAPTGEEASPSQSQSSRATRWEALADIAAELPPSLAVDPITGQIFQVAQPKRVINIINVD